jgi:propionyl-CoA carboxylase alpha chain
MIQRLLVANRGEIASRVFATCRRLGIETIAVHSDADADLPYVREADAAVRLPGSAPADTYLDIDRVLDAAKRTGADAIHPGYGFLSENADFARAVIAAGRAWVGPDPESIEQMGSKVRAKELMQDAGVPVLPNLAPDEATESDLPLLVKASAGGGGRGMRIVTDLSELAGAVETARAEAESAFGDGTVFVEPYVERSRHVEVQVVGDRSGDVLVLGERDCSLQRRHQKVVEESPAPNLAAEVAGAMHDAARAAAAAIGYVGAGTVEFLYDPERERFFFLEMNTRLQVEHPVTELVHGVDLVELQIAVAEGAPVVEEGRQGPSRNHPGGFETVAAQPPQPREGQGHAIEARLYAEDPATDYQPQSGTLTTFEIPAEDGIRVDAGYASGSEVSTHYDAMLAKVISHGPTRAEAARALARTLARARIHGVTTNRDQLVAVLRDEEFLSGRVHTGFLEGRTGEKLSDPGWALRAAVAAVVADEREQRGVQRGIPSGWRNVVSQPQETTFEVDDEQQSVAWLGDRDGVVFPDSDVRVLAVEPGRVTLEIDGIRTSANVLIDSSSLPGAREIHVDGPLGYVRLREVPRFVDPADAVASGSLLAPMPGTVISVAVEAGQSVGAGQTVLVLEAMKMQHTVTAPQAGVVTEIDVRPGAQVAAGEVLAVVEETGAEVRAERGG